MSSKIQTAIMAGVLLGVALIVIALLTALVPALSPLGCCACLLPIGAGVYAVRGWVGKSPTAVQIGDGHRLVHRLVGQHRVREQLDLHRASPACAGSVTAGSRHGRARCRPWWPGRPSRPWR